jgi:hypothetical protein
VNSITQNANPLLKKEKQLDLHEELNQLHK